jgi:phasin
MEIFMTNTDPKVRAPKPTAETPETVAAKAAAGAAPLGGAIPKEPFSFQAPFAGFELPEMFRSFTEQGLNQTRDAYSRMKAAAEEATDLIEDSLETTRENVRDVQFKALDLAKANADATFDFVRQLLAATTVADAVQLQTAFARARFEALVDYSKDVQATVTKAGTEAVKPARAMFEKAMNVGKAA